MQSSPMQYVFTLPFHLKESVGDTSIGQIEPHMDRMEESLNQLLDLMKMNNKPRDSAGSKQNLLKELNNSEKN